MVIPPAAPRFSIVLVLYVNDLTDELASLRVHVVQHNLLTEHSRKSKRGLFTYVPASISGIQGTNWSSNCRRRRFSREVVDRKTWFPNLHVKFPTSNTCQKGKYVEEQDASPPPR